MTDLQEHVAALIAKEEKDGCLCLSCVTEFVAEHDELDDDDVSRIYELLDELRDRGHGRLRPRERREHLRQRQARGRDHGRAPALPQRGRPLAAADQGGGGRAREADRARRQGGEGPDDQLQPSPRRLDREALSGPRALAARPDPGRDHRPDSRGREVRLAARVQVLDVRDLVDPPGGAAGDREQVAHDPDPRAHRRARAPDRRARSASWPRSSGGSRPMRRSPRARGCRRRSCARSGRSRARSRAWTGRSARRTKARSAT